MQNAIVKINKEIEENVENTLIEKIGLYLKELLNIDPASAEKINAEGKTLKGCLEDMRGKAKAKQKNGSYSPSDVEVIGIINGYFGITTKVCLKTVVTLADDTQGASSPAVTKSLFDLV